MNEWVYRFAGRVQPGFRLHPLLVPRDPAGYRWMVRVFCEVAVQLGQLVLFPDAITT